MTGWDGRINNKQKGIMSKLYRPSNGSEGSWFESKFCDRCQNKDYESQQYCVIHDGALLFGTKDPEYPVEWCYSENGNPICTEFKEVK